jgi:hypothetical protein
MANPFKSCVPRLPSGCLSRREIDLIGRVPIHQHPHIRIPGQTCQNIKTRIHPDIKAQTPKIENGQVLDGKTVIERLREKVRQRASWEHFQQVLARVPDVEPGEFDRL